MLLEGKVSLRLQAESTELVSELEEPFTRKGCKALHDINWQVLSGIISNIIWCYRIYNLCCIKQIMTGLEADLIAARDSGSPPQEFLLT